MAKTRLKSSRLRLFVALDLPDPVRSGLAVWGSEALVDPALRRVRPEALHVTLCFLGYRAQADVERVAAILRANAGPAPELELHGPVGRPRGARPRLYALEARSPATLALQAEIEAGLAAERLYTPERRPYWPHLTVARVRPETRGSRRPMRVLRPPAELHPELRRPFDGVRVTLYRSELQPQGARYTPLAQVELPHEGQQ